MYKYGFPALLEKKKKKRCSNIALFPAWQQLAGIEC